MQRVIRKILPFAPAALMLLAALPAAAQSPDLGLGYVQATGLSQVDIRSIVASIIRDLLGLLGLVFILKIMWSGFLLMSHGGREEKIAEAKSGMINAVVGMVIIMSASSITNFVVNAVTGVAFGSPSGLQ